MYVRRQRVLALAYGLICHTSFALGIAAMMVGIYSGMTVGRGRLTGAEAWLANAALLVQFPVLHSLLLSQAGRRVMARLAPRGLGDDLGTTTYAIVASLQLLVAFALWSPSGVIWWQPHGPALVVLALAYGAAWLVLLKTMKDADLAMHTGYLGWGAVARGRRPSYPGLSTRGTFRYVRQPIYVAFTLTLWLAPVWTPDRLALAIAWTAYCLIGPLFKERRYRRFYGAAFDAYRRLVPYWIPRLPRRRRDGFAS